MRIPYNLVSTVIFILNFIGLSSQSDFWEKGIPRAPRSKAPSPATPTHHPGRALPLGRTHFSSRSPPGSRSLIRATSRSPTPRRLRTIFGFRIEDLSRIRFIPHSCPEKVFKLRKYTFPDDMPIKFRAYSGIQDPLPNGEQVVLTTSSGDILAIVEKTYKQTTLRGLYTSIFDGNKRVKINIHTGDVVPLKPEEILDSPLGNQTLIGEKFEVLRI